MIHYTEIKLLSVPIYTALFYSNMCGMCCAHVPDYCISVVLFF